MPDEIDYSKTAWGDESVRITANPSFYAMAACVIDANALRLPLELMYLKPKSAKKLHWRELDDRGRKRALKVISEHPPKTVIVAAAPIIRNKQERARRKCLEALLIELESDGVTKLVLESRDEHLDQKDVDHIVALRRADILHNIELYHLASSTEPRLYVPDQILGAYGDSETARMSPIWTRSWKLIEANCTFLKVSP